MGEARLPVCRVLVLTHNFEVWRPVIVWLLVFVIIGLWLQSGQWQNCKSKQVVGFDFKPILFVVSEWAVAKLKGITIYRQTKRSPRKKTGAQAMCMSKLTYYDKLAVGVLFF